MAGVNMADSYEYDLFSAAARLDISTLSAARRTYGT